MAGLAMYYMDEIIEEKVRIEENKEFDKTNFKITFCTYGAQLQT
jgi:hypothetical protein